MVNLSTLSLNNETISNPDELDRVMYNGDYGDELNFISSGSGIEMPTFIHAPRGKDHLRFFHSISVDTTDNDSDSDSISSNDSTVVVCMDFSKGSILYKIKNFFIKN